MFWLENSDKKWRRQSYTKKYLARLFHIVPCQVKSQSCQNFQIQNQSTLKKFTLVFSTVVFVQGLHRGKTGRHCKNPSKTFIFYLNYENIFYCVPRNLIDFAEVF